MPPYVAPALTSVNHQSHHATFASSSGFVWISRLISLRYDELERFSYVGVEPSAGFGKSAFIMLRQLLSFFRGDLPQFCLEIALVAHDNYGRPFFSLYIAKWASPSGVTWKGLTVDIQDDWVSCRWWSGPYQRIDSRPLNKPACSHECQWSVWSS